MGNVCPLYCVGGGEDESDGAEEVVGFKAGGAGPWSHLSGHHPYARDPSKPPQHWRPRGPNEPQREELEQPGQAEQQDEVMGDGQHTANLAHGDGMQPPPPAQQPSTRKRYVAPELPNQVPTAPGVERLEPEDVYQHLQNGTCVLVDVRSEDRAAGLIQGSAHVPAIDVVPFVSKVPELVRQWSEESLVVFTCQYSAHRAPTCANWYREQSDPAQRVAILSGGFRAWEGNGFPVEAPPCAGGGSGGGGHVETADAYAVQQGMWFAAAQGGQPPLEPALEPQMAPRQHTAAQPGLQFAAPCAQQQPQQPQLPQLPQQQRQQEPALELQAAAHQHHALQQQGMWFAAPPGHQHQYEQALAAPHQHAVPQGAWFAAAPCGQQPLEHQVPPLEMQAPHQHAQAVLLPPHFYQVPPPQYAPRPEFDGLWIQ